MTSAVTHTQDPAVDAETDNALWADVDTPAVGETPAEPSTSDTGQQPVEPDGDTPADTGTTSDEEQEPDPAESEQTKIGQAVEKFAGFLAIKPGQTQLTPSQRVACKAIGIADDYDPAQVQYYLHVCQARNLDPFAKEAYLIRYGKGEKATYSIVVAIDTYRGRAAATGRYRGVVGRYWTGRDDDPKSWHIHEKNGITVRSRVWQDVWLDTENPPAAAMVVIEYHDELTGELITANAVANWEMFASYRDVWDNNLGRRTGERELNSMWAKGGPHMLAKCAEALALRAAFPAQLSGTVTSDEMSRAQAEADNDYSEELRRRIQEAMLVKAKASGKVVDGEVVPDSDGEISVDPAEERKNLVAELEAHALWLDATVNQLTMRWMRAHRKNIEDATVDELRDLVVSLRTQLVIPHLEQTGRGDVAGLLKELPPCGMSLAELGIPVTRF